MAEVREMIVTTTDDAADVAVRLVAAVDIAWLLTYVDVGSVGSAGSVDVEALGYTGVVKMLNPD